jgi:excisionase family DNA binding protein
MPESENMTLSECAKYLRVSLRTVERLVAEGEAPRAIRVGRRIIFRRRDVDTWLESRARSALGGKV